MRAEQIRESLEARPFLPFRIFMSDGGSYDIPHPDLCMVGVHHLVVGIVKRKRQQPVADVFATLALTHVSRTEPLQPEEQPSQGTEQSAPPPG